MNPNESLFDADQSYQESSPLRNQSSMAVHLRSGHGGPGFSVLNSEAQEQVLAHVMAMSQQEQADYLGRMKHMDAEDLLASVPPQVCGAMQQSHYAVKKGGIDPV